MKRRKTILALVAVISLFVLFRTQSVFAQTQEDFVQQDSGAAVLSQEQIATLNQTLNEFAQSTDQQGNKVNSQFAVYITKTTGGQSIEGFAQNLFNTKQIGDREHNRGILFVIALEDRDYRVQLGAGWNGSLLNEASIGDYVFDSDLTDMLRAENYYAAITQVVNRTIAIAGTQIEVVPSLASHVAAYHSFLERQEVSRQNSFRNLLIGIGVACSFGLIGGGVAVKYHKEKKARKVAVMEWIGMEFAFDSDREGILASDEELADTFLQTKLDINQDNIKNFLQNYRNNTQVLAKIQNTETTQDGTLKYDVNQQALAYQPFNPCGFLRKTT